MGFGILFIGYIFLLNISFYAYTDVLAGVLMLLALEKLRVWNQGFKASFFATIPFFLIGTIEFVLKLLTMFSIAVAPALSVTVAVLRMVSLCPLHICLLVGIKQITKEVGLDKMESRAIMLLPFSPLLHVCQAFFEIPSLFSGVKEQNLLTVQFILLIASLVFSFIMLSFIYKCYARICLPSDVNMEQKPSRFRFVNEYRAKKEEEQRAEIEARIAEMKQKNQKAKKKKKR